MTKTVAIVGGGAIGSSIAYFLANDPQFQGEVVVIERDPSYQCASSALSASSIRLQFSTPLNIALSRFGMEFLRDAPDRMCVDGDRPALSVNEKGYLVIASEAGLETLRELHRIQRALDVPVALLGPEEVAERFPWISTEGIAAASLGLKHEGWFDGYGLLQAFRKKARSLGVRYLADEATGFTLAGERIRSVQLKSGGSVDCDVVVNAAGPWAGKVAALIGVDLPVRARKRNVFVFSCREPLPNCPLIIDPSGLWFRPEGDKYIAGISPKEGEPDPDDLPLEVDHEIFDEAIWPALATRVPAFESIKPSRAWAGYYELNTLDHNGVVGPHPVIGNLFFANGFSGHGIQHSPGVGRGVAEFIVHGGYRSLDLAPLSFDRVLAGKPLLELNVF
ncbi:Glycine/D-amino acid oxidase [Rhizobiales bacterium GAS188]|nr:Glycine/D-amino acid oxidase [Rhizobiales bacterium GAS188]